GGAQLVAHGGEEAALRRQAVLELAAVALERGVDAFEFLGLDGELLRQAPGLGVERSVVQGHGQVPGGQTEQPAVSPGVERVGSGGEEGEYAVVRIRPAETGRKDATPADGARHARGVQPRPAAL